MQASQSSPEFSFEKFVRTVGPTLPIFRGLGYVVCLLALLNYAAALIPTRFTDPEWGIQTMGLMIESIGGILWGSLLVYIPLSSQAELCNQRLLLLPASILRWLVFGLAITHFLMAPLLIVDAFRIDNANSNQVANVQSQVNARVAQIEAQINQLPSQQLQAVRQRLAQQPLGQTTSTAQADLQPDQSTDTESAPLVSSLNPNDPSILREAVLAELQANAQQVQAQAQQQLNQQRRNLAKQVGKWFIATLLSGVLLLLLWRLAKFAPRAWSNPLPYLSSQSRA
ncbi:MAG: HpsJ family protein [Cyanobacteria bacterium P01_H01_bin.121]